MTEGVGRPSWRDGRARQALPEGQERSETPSGRLGGVGRDWDSTQEGQDNWQALLECRDGLGGPPEGPGGIGRPIRSVVRGWDELSKGL